MAERRVHLSVAAVAAVSPDARLAAPDVFPDHDSAVAQPAVVATVAVARPVAFPGVVPAKGSPERAPEQLAVVARIAVVPGVFPVRDSRAALEQLAAVAQPLVVPDLDRVRYPDRD